MSLRYIREYYGFTGKRGNACKVMGGKSGVITGSDGQYVHVRLHGENKSRIFHPSDIMFERKNESGLTQRAADAVVCLACNMNLDSDGYCPRCESYDTPRR